MSTLTPDSDQHPSSTLDYQAAEGLTEAPPAPIALEESPDRRWREWMLVGLGLTALVAILSVVTAVFALAGGGGTGRGTRQAAAAATVKPAPAATADKPAPTLADAKGIAFEPFERVDATLPPVPPGALKKFKVDVYQHVTQVAKDLAPTEVWSFAVNGVAHRGTGVSEPMVVTEGDTVDFTLVNGSSTAMKVTMPHSLDIHSAEVDPGRRYADLPPGKSMHYRFVAKHPGVFMYHCATQPVLITPAPAWSACSSSSRRIWLPSTRSCG